MGWLGMNPRLVRFAVELQTNDKQEKKEEAIAFKDSSVGNKFFNFFKMAAVSIPVSNKH